MLLLAAGCCCCCVSVCVCVCSALSFCLSSLQCFPAAFRKQLSGWKNGFPDRTTRPSPPCSSYWETMGGLLQGHEDMCVRVCWWGRFIEVVPGCLLESADLSMQQKGCHVLFRLHFPGRSHQRNVLLVSKRVSSGSTPGFSFKMTWTQSLMDVYVEIHIPLLETEQTV